MYHVHQSSPRVMTKPYARMGKGEVDDDGVDRPTDRLARLEEAVIAQQKWLRFIACLLAVSTALIIVNSTLLLPTMLQPFVTGSEKGVEDVGWEHEVSCLRAGVITIFTYALAKCNRATKFKYNISVASIRFRNLTAVTLIYHA